MKLHRAFSLTELLVVIAIIIMISTLLFPVFIRSKKRALDVPCTAQLRQVFVAWSTYLASNDERPPAGLIELSKAHNELRPILKCPSDVFGGVNSQVSTAHGWPVSYMMLPSLPGFRESLQEADPNHGLFYCILHGESTLGNQATNPMRDMTGLTLRLRNDGSIQRANVGLWCSAPGRDGSVMAGRSPWALLTDIPCKGQWCMGLDHPCK